MLSGIDEKRVIAIGKGEHEPIADNDTDEGRAINRRVEFLVQKIIKVNEADLNDDAMDGEAED